MKAFLVAALIVVTFGELPVMAQQLSSVKVHAGIVDLDAIRSGEKKLPLNEPLVETDPAFDPEVKSYRVRMPYGVEGVRLIVESSSSAGDFGVLDFNDAGGEFSAARYSRGAWTKGAVVPFRLEPGENKLRLGVQQLSSLSPSTTVYEYYITRPEAPSEIKVLTDLQLDGGELSPAFDSKIRAYRTRVVGIDSLIVRPAPSAGSSVIVLGTTADGAALTVNGDRVSGLTPGNNTIAMVVEAEDGTNELYTLIADATLSRETTLAALELANGELIPAFDPDTRKYRTRIVGNGLTVTSKPNTFASSSMLGTAANGRTLRVDGDSISGLTAGENTVTIAVRAQDGTSDGYTLIVEVSDDIRAVGAGDKISRQGDCDSDIGCNGTLNGVEGRFACSGVDWRSESTNVSIAVRGMCLLSTSEGVVKSAAGWYFAAFPASSR